jgi:acetolactate synthase small subunit
MDEKRRMWKELEEYVSNTYSAIAVNMDGYVYQLQKSENNKEDIFDSMTKDWKNALKFEADPTMFWSEDENDYSPREWGNLVHDILSQIKTVEDTDKVFNYYLNEGSIDRQEVEKLRRQFEKIVADDKVKDAYTKDAIVRNEMGIIKVGENENEMLRPDRYVELADKVILIDYKTGEHHKKYYEQLQNYADALRGMGVEKVIEPYLVYISKEDEKVDIKPVFLSTLF